MWIALSVFLLIVLMTFGLWISKQATVRQEMQLRQRTQIRMIKQQSQDIEEIIDTLVAYDANIDLLRIVLNYLVLQTDKRLLIDPYDADSLSDKQRYQQTQQTLTTLIRPQAIQPPQNDRQLTHMKRHFLKTRHFLRQCSSLGLISELETHEHQRRLQQVQLTLEVQTCLLLSNHALQQNDRLSALAYLKQGRELLLTSELSFEGKTEQIKLLSRKFAELSLAHEPDEQRTKPSGS